MEFNGMNVVTDSSQCTCGCSCGGGGVGGDVHWGGTAVSCLSETNKGRRTPDSVSNRSNRIGVLTNRLRIHQGCFFVLFETIFCRILQAKSKIEGLIKRFSRCGTVSAAENLASVTDSMLGANAKSEKDPKNHTALYEKCCSFSWVFDCMLSYGRKTHRV